MKSLLLLFILPSSKKPFPGDAQQGDYLSLCSLQIDNWSIVDHQIKGANALQK